LIIKLRNNDTTIQEATSKLLKSSKENVGLSTQLHDLHARMAKERLDAEIEADKKYVRVPESFKLKSKIRFLIPLRHP